MTPLTAINDKWAIGLLLALAFWASRAGAACDAGYGYSTSVAHTSDFSTKAAMLASGWASNCAYDVGINDPYGNAEKCQSSVSWAGFSQPGEGTVWRTLSGSGTATLNYGNCHTGGTVTVYLNGVAISSAAASTMSQEVVFSFSDGALLQIKEATAIIKMNSFVITSSSCSACEAGKYKDAAGNGACSQCTAGRYGSTVVLSGVTYIAGNTPPNRRTFSSMYHDCNDPSWTLLYSAGHVHAWCAATRDTNQWQTLDVGNVQLIAGVATQGRASTGQWVTSYTVQYSVDGASYLDVNNGAMFIGNIDTSTIRVNTFPEAVQARYIRIRPQTWNGWVSMRCDVMVRAGVSGCGGESAGSCYAGYYSADNGATCTACEAGYSTAGTDTRGASAAACDVCAAGYVGASVEGRRGCSACEAGKHTATSDSCVDCLAGTYAAAAGASRCSNCEAGKYSRARASECRSCPAGFSALLERSTGCKPCSAGRYSSEGASECSLCAAGTYSPASHTRCVPCPAGSFSETGASKCLFCDKGKYSAGEGAGACTACPTGETSEKAGLTACSSCSA